MLGHVLTQNLIDARLPALAFLAVGVEHVRVNAKSLIDLADVLRWAAPATAHEINNRLALTVGYSELLMRSPALPEGLREIAREALEGGLWAASLLQDLQKIVRLEEVGASPLVESVLDLRRSTHQEE